MTYKIVMLAYLRQEENIIMAKGLTKKEAEERVEYYKTKDKTHNFKIEVE